LSIGESPVRIYACPNFQQDECLTAWLSPNHG
jgi:hypothetical protein